ncbi:acyl carrier protein [Zavarzinella formosa]|uniref:hypothetical protein n=1 Tax=Zavarzinella formosa TaxID=360055 RepID=UPI0002E39F65|nr:hypothetical protein [Zavarzinella formosa]
MAPLIICVSALALLAIIVVIMAVKRDQAFEQRFPPISDEEFMARCRPGTNPAVALKIRRIIADHLAVEYGRIYPSSSFIEDLGAD